MVQRWPNLCVAHCLCLASPIPVVMRQASELPTACAPLLRTRGSGCLAFLDCMSLAEAGQETTARRAPVPFLLWGQVRGMSVPFPHGQSCLREKPEPGDIQTTSRP